MNTSLLFLYCLKENHCVIAASVSEQSFFLYHTKIHDMVKGRLASSRLDNFVGKLQNEFEQQMAKLGTEGSVIIKRLRGT